MEYKIVNLSQKPEILDRAARWFHEKWEVPLEAYRESMGWPEHFWIMSAET